MSDETKVELEAKVVRQVSVIASLTTALNTATEEVDELEADNDRLHIEWRNEALELADTIQVRDETIARLRGVVDGIPEEFESAMNGKPWKEAVIRRWYQRIMARFTAALAEKEE